MRTARCVVAIVMVAAVALPAAADALQDAMDRADALNLMLQLGVQRPQARQMIGPLQNIQRLVSQYDAARTEALNRLTPTLQRARMQLVGGEELGDEMVAALDGYRQQREEARLELYRAVHSEMTAISEVLRPEQNQYLDWTPPGSIRPEECLEERLRMQQVAMGRIQKAAQMLDAVKHLHAFNFVTGRGPIVNDYLALYFDPNTEQFAQAFQIVINYTDQVRMITEEQWQAQSLDIAAGLVERLGLMPTMDPGQRPGTVSWSTLFELLTDPQTLEVVRELAGQ